MTTPTNLQGSATCPIHPFDQGLDGVNRPGLYKHKAYHEVRETGTGVTEVVRADGTRAKLVTRFDDVKHVLSDQKVFSRENALDIDPVNVEGTLLGLDLDNHAAVRGIVKNLFTPQAVGLLSDQIEARGASQLEVMVGQGEPADLIEGFALPFALDVVGDMLGLPQEDRLQFRQWGEAFLATSALSKAEAAASEQAMVGYLIGLIEQRRQNPTGDLLSRIATDGAHLPFDRLIKLPLALLVGGWETTASSIGTFVQVLLTHPYGEHETAYDYLIEYPAAIDGAITELERMFSTSAADEMPRRVMGDAKLPSGARLQAGDIVIPSHDAANFDPRVYSDPHRMDFGRTPNRHLSFGHGAHHCIGRYLAHAEVVTATTLLTRELPGLRLAIPVEDIPRKTGHAISGPIKLPVAWS